MGHGKETPRQKMIGMMYLVLTALLALNVQKEVLNAFVTVDEGLTKMNENYAKKNETLYKSFDQAYAENPSKAGPWLERAKKVKEQADLVYNFIQDLKIEILARAEKGNDKVVKGKEVFTVEIQGKENMDIPAEVMIVKGKGKALKSSIETFRSTLISFIDPKGGEKVKEAIEKSLNTDAPPVVDGKQESWESEHFEQLPLVGVITIMSGLQANVRNAESDILRYLYTMIDKGSFKFNVIEATVIPKSDYVIQGNEYQAKVFIAAFDNTKDPEIFIGPYDSVKNEDGSYRYTERANYKYESVPVKNGKGLIKRTGGAIGYQRMSGIIKLRAPEGGNDLYRPFKLEYQVAEPMLVVSPTKMNVFYIGVDNPVEISVPGVPADRIFPSISNGNIRKEGKGYIVNPSRAGQNAQVTVVAEVEKNVKKNMGMKEFRVKIVPDPVAKVAGIKGSGGIDKAVLMAQAGVVAEMENFEFDLQFKVTEFIVSTVVGGFTQDKPSKSNRFTTEQMNLIKGASRNQKVYIEGIKAVGPDGTTRQLGSIALTIK